MTKNADDKKENAETLKKRGNAAFVTKEFETAIDLYSQALEEDTPGRDGILHILHSNRSLAYSKAGNIIAAIKDARRATTLKPNWSKGFYRLGLALLASNRDGEHGEALAALKMAIKLDPRHQVLQRAYRESLSNVKKSDLTREILSPRAWVGVYSRVHDVRVRMYVLARFWNASARPVRLRIFERFVDLVSTPEGVVDPFADVPSTLSGHGQTLGKEEVGKGRVGDGEGGRGRDDKVEASDLKGGVGRGAECSSLLAAAWNASAASSDVREKKRVNSGTPRMRLAEEQMMDLPLKAYENISFELPPNWLKFFVAMPNSADDDEDVGKREEDEEGKGDGPDQQADGDTSVSPTMQIDSGGKDKVDVLEDMYRVCSEKERKLIINDLRFFFMGIEPENWSAQGTALTPAPGIAIQPRRKVANKEKQRKGGKETMRRRQSKGKGGRDGQRKGKEKMKARVKAKVRAVMQAGLNEKKSDGGSGRVKGQEKKSWRGDTTTRTAAADDSVGTEEK